MEPVETAHEMVRPGGRPVLTLTDRYKHLRTPEQIRRALASLGAAQIKVTIGGNGVEASCTRPASGGPRNP